MKAVRIEHNEFCNSTYRFETEQEARIFIRDLFEGCKITDRPIPIVWLLNSGEILVKGE